MKQSQKRERVLVVGAGLTGSTLARCLAERGEAVVVIDRRDHVGGNCYDQRCDGITLHRYGAHIFHTDDEVVWRFLSCFTAWRPYEHHVLARIGEQLVPLPFNLNTLDLLLPDQAAALREALLAHFAPGQRVTILQLRQAADPQLRQLADYVYEHVFLHYTLKQWECRLEELDPSVAARVPVSISRDDRYFVNQYQGIPRRGYTALVTNMLTHSNIEVRVNTDWAAAKSEPWRRVYFTGAIDEYFAYCYGALPYRSLELVTKKYAREFFQPVSVVNYPETEKFTRIIEHKYFLGEQSAHTLVTREYPRRFVPGQGERYYPINNDANDRLYQRYLELAETVSTVRFCGRLGDYRYYDMDKAVARALAVVGA